MLSFVALETACQKHFDDAGLWYHACSSENFPVFLVSDSDYKLVYSLLGLTSMMYPEIHIVAFELMSNHIHFIAVGDKSRVEAMLKDFVSALQKDSDYLTGRQSLTSFQFKLHNIDNLKYARNAIAYVHRNRFLVDSSVTPFMFRWGSNQLYFNPSMVSCINSVHQPTTQRWRRNVTHRHTYDNFDNVKQFDGYVSPLCFCDYAMGEALFRSARHYYETTVKSVEGMAEIAKIIGEGVILTDDELFRTMLSMVRKKYSCDNISELQIDQRLEIANQLHYGYNATAKQLCRMLKLEHSVIESLLGI